LLFYASLFDHEKAIRLSKSSPQHGSFRLSLLFHEVSVPDLGVLFICFSFGCLAEMVEAIATRNIELFNYFQAVVRRYIDKNGRGCVEMRSIFSFM
jgi:hypothetical protein